MKIVTNTTTVAVFSFEQPARKESSANEIEQNLFLFTDLIK